MPTHQQVIEGLIRERDEAREAQDRLLVQQEQLRWLEGFNSRLLGERRVALRERDELRQALRDYGEHDACCPRRTEAFHGSLSAGVLHERGGGEACTCGLERLLAEEPALPKEKLVAEGRGE